MYLHIVADTPAEQSLADGRLRRNAADARDLQLHPLASLVLDLDARADPNDVARFRRVLVDDHRAVEAIAKQSYSSLEQALLVLRRVVFEILGEIAEAASRCDGLNGLGTARSLQLGQLGLELFLLSNRQRLGPLARHGGSVPSLRMTATVPVRVGIQSPGEMSFSFLLRVFRGRQVSNP